MLPSTDHPALSTITSLIMAHTRRSLVVFALRIHLPRHALARLLEDMRCIDHLYTIHIPGGCNGERDGEERLKSMEYMSRICILYSI